MHLKRLIVIVGIWTLSMQAEAAKMTVREIKCPFEEDSVRIFSLVSDNQTGGYDSDLAIYSSGQQFRSVAVSTCYNNLFSFYGKDKGIKINSNQRKAVKNAIRKTKKTFQNPNDPKVWERYALAESVYSTLNKPAYVRANLMIEASWTIRDSIVGFHRGLNGPESVKKILDLGPKELKKDLSPNQRKLLIYNLARVSHRGGYNDWRDHYMNLFVQLPNLSPEDKKSAEDFKKAASILEPLYQRKSMALYKSALSDGLSSEKRERATYLIADINRRLGNYKDAIKGYKKISETTKNPQLKALADFFIKNDLRMEPNSP